MDSGAADVGGSQFLATTVAACLTRLQVKWRPSISCTELSHLGMKCKWTKYTAIFYLSIYVYNIHILYSCKYVYFWVRYVYLYIYIHIWNIGYCTQANRQFQFRRSSALQISWHSSESPSRTTCKQKVKVSLLKGQLQKWRCPSFSCLYTY